MGGLLIPDLHLLLPRSVEEEALDRGKLTLVPIGGRRGGSHEMSSYRWCSSAAYGGSYDVVDSWDHFRIGILCRRMSFLSFGYYSDEILRHFSTNIFPQVFRQMICCGFVIEDCSGRSCGFVLNNCSRYNTSFRNIPALML
uniref:Uncharacterized protein LOC114914794 n=1 Tax=Elaeis guineensis var. tenera TaxID=51953 RepID=A0A8N4F404_ELAGV|nr:uncharacterized protein LOC114914794 [Elaeis guineensis]